MKTWNEMSSRERDALIAEKVFGHSISRAMTWGKLLMLREGNAGLTEEIPPYTTSMDAAWTVLQHMAAQFDYKPWNRLINELFGADGEELSPSYRYMASVVKWTPADICFAALRAMGCEIEKEGNA